MISLRPLLKEDLLLAFEWENIPELWQVSEQQGPYNMEEIETFHAKCLDQNNPEIERLVICLELLPIGAIDIFEYDETNNHCGLGIFIAKQEHRGKGYGAIALNHAIGVLNRRGCQVIRSIIYSNNTSSRRLFLNAGFSEGAAIEYNRQPAHQFIWTRNV
jgi:RimJ/RimL family protein N-acetyltransferase